MYYFAFGFGCAHVLYECMCGGSVMEYVSRCLLVFVGLSVNVSARIITHQKQPDLMGRGPD